VFDGLYSSGQRDQYRARLERAKDGGNTEVYITHRGMEEVLSSDGTSSKWQTRPSDPEMEAVMLQKLMVRFGGSEVQAASAVTTSARRLPWAAMARPACWKCSMAARCWC